MKKPMTADDVLAAWIETQIGSTSYLRPRGYESIGAVTVTPWAETRRRAATLVESLPMFDIAKPYLVEYCQSNGSGTTGLAVLFIEGLTDYLREHPFYASSSSDAEESARPVVYLTCMEAAEALGMKPSSVRNLVCQGAFRHTRSDRRQLSIWADEVYAYRDSKSRK